MNVESLFSTELFNMATTSSSTQASSPNSPTLTHASSNQLEADFDDFLDFNAFEPDTNEAGVMDESSLSLFGGNAATSEEMQSLYQSVNAVSRH
jgi:hypothetical protein